MSGHLSHEQFARCFVETPPQLQGHVRNCPECAAELERFAESLGQLRGAIRGRIDAQVASMPGPPAHRQETGPQGWQWALVAATVVMVGLIPFAILDTKPGTRAPEAAVPADPSDLMDSINLHLSRDLPAPMEPMLVFPHPRSKPGGIQ